MANYVSNKVICSKETFNRYFIDHTPFGDGCIINPPYISFNRLFGVKSINEYEKAYGVIVYYGFGSSWNECPNGLVEVKFCTRWQYPISAILKALNLAHDTVWYAVEESHSYVSQFIWHEKVCEYVTILSDEYCDWEEVNDDFISEIENFDDDVWYYLDRINPIWQLWETSDNYKRYSDSETGEILK